MSLKQITEYQRSDQGMKMEYQMNKSERAPTSNIKGNLHVSIFY